MAVPFRSNINVYKLEISYKGSTHAYLEPLIEDAPGLEIATASKLLLVPATSLEIRTMSLMFSGGNLNIAAIDPSIITLGGGTITSTSAVNSPMSLKHFNLYNHVSSPMIVYDPSIPGNILGNDSQYTGIKGSQIIIKKSNGAYINITDSIEISGKSGSSTSGASISAASVSVNGGTNVLVQCSNNNIAINSSNISIKGTIKYLDSSNNSYEVEKIKWVKEFNQTLIDGNNSFTISEVPDWTKGYLVVVFSTEDGRGMTYHDTRMYNNFGYLMYFNSGFNICNAMIYSDSNTTTYQIAVDGNVDRTKLKLKKVLYKMYK